MKENNNGSFKPKRTYFSQVSNTALRDNKLSLKAKGLYALIQSYITIENFTLYKNTLKKNCPEGNKAFENAWKELKDKGYLIQERHQNEDGTFYYLYELLDVPIHTPKKEGTVKGVYGKRGQYSKTDSIDTDSNKTLKHLHSLDQLKNEYISFYLRTMSIFRPKHKRVTEENLYYIEKTIENLDIDIEEWKEAVIEHFRNLPKNNDGDILAFLKAADRYFRIGRC